MLAAGISIWATSYLAAAIVGSVFLAGTANTQIQRTYSSSVIGQAQAAFGGCCRWLVLSSPAGLIRRRNGRCRGSSWVAERRSSGWL